LLLQTLLARLLTLCSGLVSELSTSSLGKLRVCFEANLDRVSAGQQLSS
jgi:hypothetical protein